MKRLHMKGLGILACLMIALLMSKSVKADLIWTPNDDFFEKHYEECEQLGRSYMANGEDGYVELKKDPLSKETVENVKNGEEFFVSFTYTDKKGKVWGVVEYDDSTGWILMEELSVIYDNISFMEEHKEKIKDYQGEFDDIDLGEEPVQFYQYPGSGTSISAIEIKEEKPEFSYTYEDSEGRLWGYIAYHFAHRGWVCLSDPTNTNIPSSKEQPDVTIIPPATELPDPASSSFSTEVILIVVLVMVVVLGTAVSIRVFWKKK
jgi:hypothetical protein